MALFVLYSLGLVMFTWGHSITGWDERSVFTGSVFAIGVLALWLGAWHRAPK